MILGHSFIISLQELQAKNEAANAKLRQMVKDQQEAEKKKVESQEIQVRSFSQGSFNSSMHKKKHIILWIILNLFTICSGRFREANEGNRSETSWRNGWFSSSWARRYRGSKRFGHLLYSHDITLFRICAISALTQNFLVCRGIACVVALI